jgi:hypothetical protein
MKRALILAVLLIAAGCDKKADGPAAGGGPTTTDEKPAVLVDDDLPVKSDFVEEAEGSINKDNYKSELEKVSAEIDKE